MKIDAQIETGKVEEMTLRMQKRLVYNTVQALNKTALAAQAAIRADMEKNFFLRSTPKHNKQWLLQRIKVNFAGVKKGQLFAEVFIDSKDRLLLTKFETGDTREPFVGKNVARPFSATAREGGTEQGAVKQELTFAALKFKPVEVTPGGKRRPSKGRPYHPQYDTVQFKGLQRTFILKHTEKAFLGGVYQRIGPGKDDVRLVYSFAQAYQLKRLLHFFAQAEKTFRDKFKVEYAITSAGDVARDAT